MVALIRYFKIVIAVVLAALVSCTLMQQSVLKNELKHVTNNAMYATQKVLVDNRYPISSDDEYVAEFIQNTLRSVTSKGKYEFKVYTADSEKGILDIEITVRFKYITGTEGQFSIRRTNIIDQITNDE